MADVESQNEIVNIRENGVDNPLINAEIAATTKPVQKKKSNTSSKKTIFILVQVLVLLLILGFLLASLIVHVLKTHRVGGLQIWKWCMFALSVLCGFALVLWTYWPVMLLIEKAFALEKEVIYFVYGIRKSGAFFIWWVWVLLMWLILMEQSLDRRSERAVKALDITTRTIISLAAASLAWVLVTVALRVLSVKCRFNRYIDKIQESATELDLLRTLAEPVETSGDGLNCCVSIKVNVGKTGSQNKMNRFYTLNPDTLNFLNENYIVDSDHKTVEFSNFKEVGTDVAAEAKRAADLIIRNVTSSRTRDDSPSESFNSISIEDLRRHTLTEDQIKLVRDKCNTTGSQSIDANVFTAWVTQVYEDRKVLFQALNDNKTATKKLDVLLRIALVLMSATGWLLWIDILTTELLIAFLSSVGACVFIFGDSMKMAFQSIFFVFFVHPFDIGDKCTIDNAKLVVEQMDISTTIFLNANMEMTYYPNYILLSKVIANSSRSSILSDSVSFSIIEMETPIEKIAILEETIKLQLEMSSLIVEGSDGQGGTKMTVQFSYKNNAQGNQQLVNKKSEVTQQLMEILHDLNIKSILSPSPLPPN